MNTPLPSIDRNSPRPLFGLSISYPAPGILERIGSAWDWIWIDGQHGDLDYRDAATLVRTCELIKRPAIVRIPAQDPTWISRMLDVGAAGIIVPMIESLKEAQAAIQAAKFPPVGNRSYGGMRVSTRAGDDYYKTANRDTVLILQLESDRAVALADKLAALAGVDGLFIGPDDLLIRSGRDTRVPKNMDAIGKQSTRVSKACRRHGKLNVGIATNEIGVEMAKRFGHQLVVGTDDVLLLDLGSAARIKTMREEFGLGKPPR